MHSGLFGAEGLTKEAPHGFTMIKEGTAALLFPPAALKNAMGHQQTNNIRSQEEKEEKQEENAQAVFYNPAQVVNRDLSVCVLACFSRLRREEGRRKGGTRDGITILEALSATGLRAIRYYKEIAGVRFIIANDLDPDAVACIRRNCEFNHVPCVRPNMNANFPAENICIDEATGTIKSGGAVIPNLDDANDLMFRLSMNSTVYAGRRVCVTASQTTSDCNSNAVNVEPLLQQELMDVVDLDPYGSASPFLDAAMRCVKEGGLLLVTSTDSAILCGNYPDTCHAKYNTLPVKNAACHEMAVRILLAAMERVANKHRKYIVPLLSLHIDFYVRCFVRVYTQAAEVKLSSCKMGYMLQCSHCPAYWIRPMAVTRMRSKKHARSKDIQHHEDNTNGAEDTRESNCKADMLGRECFPHPPSREENPKIASCNLQHMMVSISTRCCSVCGAYMTLSGPIYAAPTQNFSFLSQLLQEIEQRGAAKQITAEARTAGLVRLAMEELSDTPLFFQLPDIASFVRTCCPPTPLFVGALGRLGYRCSQVHCAPSGIKTDCPPNILVRVMLQWKCKQLQEALVAPKIGDVDVEKVNTLVCENSEHESNEGAVKEGKNGNGKDKNNKKREVKAFLPLVKPLAEADFSYNRQFDYRGTVTGVAKFIPNAPNWGPKARHRGAVRDVVTEL